MSTILVCALVTALAAGSGYWLSRKFWGTDYSSTNTSGDFGSPRGGVFATMGGTILGMLFVSLLGKYIFPADTLGPALLTAMITGTLGGFAGAFAAINARFKANQKKKDEETKGNGDQNANESGK